MAANNNVCGMSANGSHQLALATAGESGISAQSASLAWLA